MPTILRKDKYRFHFYSDEYNEPPHIHIASSEGECKFWLEPIRLAKNIGLRPHVLREIEQLVYDNSDYLMEKYNEFHINR
jgi:hypothetical protein